MHAVIRMPLLGGTALLFVAASCALAQSALPDPVAPAVIGRPLDPLRPARPKAVRPRPAAAHSAAAPTAATIAVARPSVAAAQPVSAAQAVPVTQRHAKQALDDRADPGMRLGEVGTGTHFARKPLGEGAYFADRHRSAARQYYAEHPVMRPAVKWKIGEPVPGDAVVAIVPRSLQAVLPPVPPGHQYVELGGDVVLIATGSRMVVDGISRAGTGTAMVSR